jgi:hypothetical protein
MAGPDGRAWYLTMDGYLYGGRGDSLGWYDWRVVRLHSIDGAGNPVYTPAIPSGWSYQDFRYNPSSDKFWALAGDTVFKDGSAFTLDVWVRFDWARIDDDFDPGIFEGVGDWYVDVSGWRVLNDTGLGGGFYNFGYVHTWQNVTTSNVTFRVQVWEDDDRIDTTVNFAASQFLFWDSDHQGTWSTGWEWNNGANRNEFHFTFGVNEPSEW